MNLFKNIFKSKKKSKPVKKKEVLNYKELAIIANDNVRYLSALIKTVSALANGLGKREAKKRQHIIEELELKLTEEIFYANMYTNLSKRVQQKSQI